MNEIDKHAKQTADRTAALQRRLCLPECQVCGDFFRAHPAVHDMTSIQRFDVPVPGGLLKAVFAHFYQPVPARKK